MDCVQLRYSSNHSLPRLRLYFFIAILSLTLLAPNVTTAQPLQQEAPIYPHGAPQHHYPQPPPPPAAADDSQQQFAQASRKPRNSNLLISPSGEIGKSFRAFVETNVDTIRSCASVNRQPGGCDPEVSLNPCIACKDKRMKWFGTSNPCPTTDSFPPHLQTAYYWQSAGSSQVNALRKAHICVVRENPTPAATPFGPHTNSAYNRMMQQQQRQQHMGVDESIQSLMLGGMVLAGFILIMGLVCCTVCAMKRS